MVRIFAPSTMVALPLLLFLAVWCAAVADDGGSISASAFVDDGSSSPSLLEGGGGSLRGGGGRRLLPDDEVKDADATDAGADIVSVADILAAGEGETGHEDILTNVFDAKNAKKGRHMTFCEKFASADREPEHLGPIRASLANVTSSAAGGGGLRSFGSASTSANSAGSEYGQPGGSKRCLSGKAGGFDCLGVDLASFLPLDELNDQMRNYVRKPGANDLWGWTDTSSRREFVIIGLSAGVALVEVTIAEEPVYFGNILGANNGRESLWRDIKVYNNHAYMVSEASGHGLQVFDLRRLLSLPPNQIPRRFDADGWYRGFSNAHNIEINEESGYAYAVGTNKCNEGLFMINLANDPKNPRFAGCFGDDGYTHDVHCVYYKGPDSYYRGREICFACNEDEVTIVDVTSKSNPRKISSTGYSGRRYTHQGWLTEDHRYFVFGDEADEMESRVPTKTYTLDVTNLDDPRISGVHTNFKTRAIDHNQYIRGKHSYQANYDAGLRIMDVSDVGTGGRMREVGYFDVQPNLNKAEFKGAWSTYPYFPSGTVVVSSTNQGLYVLKPDVLKGSDGQNPGGGQENVLYRERFEFPGQGMAKARGVTRVDAPSDLPRGEDGVGEYVGRVVIQTTRKTVGGTLDEDDWIDVPPGGQVRVEAVIALAERKSGRIRFQPVLAFDNGSAAAGPWQAMGNMAHQRWVRYEGTVKVPRGATKVKRVAVRTRNLAPNAAKQVLYVATVVVMRS